MSLIGKYPDDPYLVPRMLDLAKERTLGTHPYFIDVEHTRFARERLGDGEEPVEALLPGRHDENRTLGRALSALALARSRVE